jgi:H+-translocating NAD(P) transhydrogenase subunit beta
MTPEVMSTAEVLIGFTYFIAAFLFILGLKRMTHPLKARGGNRLAAFGMTMVLVATLFSPEVQGNYALIALGLLIGGGIGVLWGLKVKMTGMPQMVALLNGMGGGTAAIVSFAEFMKATDPGLGFTFSAGLGAIIGGVSLTGSVIAFAKLQELMSEKPIVFPGQVAFNGLVALAALGAAGSVMFAGTGLNGMIAVLALAALLGVLIVIPIGGADMPVVIAVLNSCTGGAAALTGFVVDNQVLIVAGAVVCSSGTLLTLLMAHAMNRSVGNVFFGSSTAAPAVASGTGPRPAGNPIGTSAEDVAVALTYSRSVVIVPGYGLAVAQAQHVVRELSDELSKKGVEVRYAIHPVAGRMPGHLNVVLADADVPYEQLIEMEAINGDFPSTDVVLVIGANDVVNPAARSDKTSPIYGMPILDVDRAKTVVVLKRGMSFGFAGIDNELFYRSNTRMLFGDAKKSLTALVAAVREN